jgi:hypothetical protein
LISLIVDFSWGYSRRATLMSFRHESRLHLVEHRHRIGGASYVKKLPDSERRIMVSGVSLLSSTYSLPPIAEIAVGIG